MFMKQKPITVHNPPPPHLHPPPPHTNNKCVRARARVFFYIDVIVVVVVVVIVVVSGGGGGGGGGARASAPACVCVCVFATLRFALVIPAHVKSYFHQDFITRVESMVCDKFRCVQTQPHRNMHTQANRKHIHIKEYQTCTHTRTQ